MSGFEFNPNGTLGVEPQLRPGLARHLRAREREINAVAKDQVYCAGGPLGGHQIALERGGRESITFTIGRWPAGRYVLTRPGYAEWRAT